jgi:hypothetical protein
VLDYALRATAAEAGAGGVVSIPAGVYRLSATLNVTTAKVASWVAGITGPNCVLRPG